MLAAGLAGLAFPATALAGLVEEAGSPIPVGSEPFWATAADFNGDGRPDLAVANDSSSLASGSVSVLLRQAGGGFAQEAGSPITVGGRPDSVGAGDFNGDGRRDIAVANFFDSTVTVLLRKADNTGFDAEGSPISVGTSPHSIAAGDFNGDGRTDLATPSFALNTVSVLLRKADNGGFEEEAGSPVGVGLNPTQLAIADFDGDTRTDIASANSGSDDVTVLLRRNDNTGFAAELGTPPAAGDGPVGIVSADFNADSRRDLAVTGETSDDLTVLLRQSGGGFAAAPGSPHPAGDGAYGLASADFNGDGRADLAATAFQGNRLTILHGTGGGQFAQAGFSPLLAGPRPLVPAVADFDGNGRSDIAIPNNSAHTVSVRLNRADGAAAPPPIPPAGCLPPTAGRVGLWRAEDSALDSAGGKDGTLENGGAFGVGRVGSAFSLPGTDDYVHVPDRADLDITGDLTLETWVRLDDENFGNPDAYGVGGDRVIFWKTDQQAGGAASYVLWIEGDPGRSAQAAPLRFAAGSSFNASFVDSQDLAWTKDTWYHLAVTRSGSAISFYRDGTLVGSASIPQAGASTAGTPLAIGAAPEQGTIYSPIRGNIDEAAVWDRALTPAEVKAVRDSVTGDCALPVNLERPSIRQVQSHLYVCEPGTWAGRDPALGYQYSWQRMTRSDQHVGGYAIETVSHERAYHPRAYTKFELGARSWLFRCVVEAANANGSTTAESPSLTLDPEYDPLVRQPPYGNFRIRGIDVFQVVQPHAGSPTFRFEPGEGAGGLPNTYGFDMAGGGTPTSFLSGGVLPDGADPQRADYGAVPLDETKAATAVVYVDRSTNEPGYNQNQKLLVTLRGRARGRVLGEFTQTMTAPEVTRTPYVTLIERDREIYGEQFKIPDRWLRDATEGTLALEAEVRLQSGFSVSPPRQCDGDCRGDDRYHLDGIAVARMPRISIASVDMPQKNQSWTTTIGDLLSKSREVFPGGERMSIFATGASIPVDVPAEGSPECNYLASTRPGSSCFKAYMSYLIVDFENRELMNGTRNYDALFGLHEVNAEGWTMKGGTFEDMPAYVVQPTSIIGVADARGRPLTTAAHELGHQFGLKHAGQQCPVPMGFTENKTGRGAAQEGELWPNEDRGRLQGVKFDRNEGGGLVLDPADGPPKTDPLLDSGDDAAPPATPDGGENGPPAGNLFDLMSYCGVFGDAQYSWISARNWNHSYRTLRDFAGRLNPFERTLRMAAAVSTQAYAVGVVGPGGGRIGRVVPALRGAATIPSAPSSPLRLRSLDAQGNALLDAGAVVREDTEGGVGGAFSGPVAPDAASVELVASGQVLHRVERTQPPGVRVTAPRRSRRARKAIVVRWQANDPDGQALNAVVEFSVDGGRRWTTVFQGPSTGRALIARAALPASRRGRLRVSVNDGFNETRAPSGLVRTAGSRPRPRIITPGRSEPLLSGERTLLEGSALDDRRRELRGRSLAWFAGRRRLGTGPGLVRRLPAGRYVLRLVARDRTGRTGVARVRVRVARPLLRLLRLDFKRQVGRRTRTLAVTVAASERATLSIGGRAYRVGPRARRVRVRLPRRPRSGVLRIRSVLAAPGGRRIAGAIGVLRR